MKFFKKCFQRPTTAIVDGIKSNVVDRIKPSSVNRIKSYIPGSSTLTNIAQSGLDSLPSSPGALLSSIPGALPSFHPSALLSSIPNVLPSFSPSALLSSITGSLGSLLNFSPSALLSSITGALLNFSPSALLSTITGALLNFAPGALLSTIAGALLSLSSPLALLTASPLLIIFLPFLPIWYLFFNDRNMILASYEYFGRGVGRFSGKVVWLVGASTSLGEEMALELASYGAKLILSARRTDILKQIKTDCIEKSKGKLTHTDILVLPFDVTEMDKKYVEEAINHFGKIDVFINNVGHIALGEASKLGIAADKANFEVNFFGPVFLIKNVVQHFSENSGGQIIMISSVSGKIGIPGQASTSASKQALHGYLDSLRLECRKYKISVTMVCPGLIRSSVIDNSVLAGTSKITPEEMEKIGRKGLKTKRCAHLALAAGANKTFECCLSNQPFLFLVALAQYFPGINKYVMGYLFPDKRLQKIYVGKSPNIWSWRPLFVI